MTIAIIGTRKVKYLNNRDLLAEIHKSKCSFSSFTKPDYQQYDIILPNLEKVNIRTIAEAKRNRAKRLGIIAFTEARMAGDKKVKLGDVTPDYKTIAKTDIVIRIMTYDHVPLAPGRKKTTKTTADSHEKVNFPPFQHWKFNDEDELVCVGKSHWRGGMKTGKFSKEHGRITEGLGRMFIKLSERYAQRSNWRGYTYIDEMKGQAILQLSQIGLQFDESKSENPFAYYTAAVTNSFTRILNIEKKNQNIRDDMLEEAGLTPSSTRQNAHEYAEETARQAELYKNLRMPKSDEAEIEEEDGEDAEAKA
ncbi:MAG: hypothetical protein RL348_1357 [Bacteroidota bacterium]|jgi:hypothetical protein